MRNSLIRVTQIAGAIVIAWIVINVISEWNERRRYQAVVYDCLHHRANWRVMTTDWCIFLQADVESGARNSDGTLVDPEVARARALLEDRKRQREARVKCDTRSWFGLVGEDRCPPGTP
jgi:hypothetical protein